MSADSLLLLAQQDFTAEVRDRFPVGHSVHIDGRDRRPNFILSAVCRALIVRG